MKESCCYGQWPDQGKRAKANKQGKTSIIFFQITLSLTKFLFYTSVTSVSFEARGVLALHESPIEVDTIIM